MAKLAKWYKNIIDELKETIEYKIESISFDISIQIYKQMEKLGLSKKDLAERLNVSKSYITQLLKGKSNITLETLIKVADALELEPKVELVPKVAESKANSVDVKANWLNKHKYISTSAAEENFSADVSKIAERIKEKYYSASDENEKLAIA